MIAMRVTPRVVLAGLTIHCGIWLLLYLAVLLHREPHLDLIEASFQSTASVFAFTLALCLNIEVAGEYRRMRWLRWAWLFLGANAGFSIAREIVESRLLSLIWKGYTDSPLQGVHQHLAIVPANLFLLLGVAAMLWSYHRVGIGFAVLGHDYAEIAGIFLLFIGLVFSRAGLTQAESPYFIGRFLQALGLGLLALVGAASVILRRVAVQMGGGKLALALRWLTLYVLVRGTLVLGEAVLSLHTPIWRQTPGAMQLLDGLCWQTVPWLAVFAASYRADLTVHATRELQRHLASKAAAVPV